MFRLGWIRPGALASILGVISFLNPCCAMFKVPVVDVEPIRADIAAFRNEQQAANAEINQGLANVGGDVAGLKLTVGGGTNDIVSWIMAGGYVVILAGGVVGVVLYVLGIRPLRKRFWPDRKEQT